MVTAGCLGVTGAAQQPARGKASANGCLHGNAPKCATTTTGATTTTRASTTTVPATTTTRGSTTTSSSSSTTTTRATTTTVSTTTVPATTTTRSSTTTSVPTGCTGVALTNGQADIDAHGTGTAFCMTGTHNWTLNPKAGDTIAGGILDGANATDTAVYAVAGATNVTIRNMEIRNYRTRGDAQGAIQSVDSTATGWNLNGLNVHDNGAQFSGSWFGAGAAIGGGWHVNGGRYWLNRQEGLTNGDGTHDVVIDGVEMDHNDLVTLTDTSGAASCPHEAGGMKFSGGGDVGITVKNSNVHDNACMGIWTDISASGIVIQNNTIARNWNSAIQIEISLSATITSNTITGNGFSANTNTFHSGCSAPIGAGIFNSSSGNVSGTNASLTFSGNTLSANCNGITLANFSDSCCRAANTTVLNNNIAGCDATNCSALEVSLAENKTGYFGSNWPDGNSFSGNTFSHGAIFCASTC